MARLADDGEIRARVRSCTAGQWPGQPHDLAAGTGDDLASRCSWVRLGFSGKVGSSLTPLGHTRSSASPPVDVPATGSARAVGAGRGGLAALAGWHTSRMGFQQPTASSFRRRDKERNDRSKYKYLGRPAGSG